MRRLVILETPYRGDIPRNRAYAAACLRDSLLRGEAPLASHVLYTLPGVLDDEDPAERKLGIAAGHEWYRRAEACVAYYDLGFSDGMQEGIAVAHSHKLPVELRSLDAWRR